jgi:hypothetical protein
MQYPEPYLAVEGHDEDDGRQRISLLPSFHVGLLLSPVVFLAAALCAVMASSSIERWFAVRKVYEGTLDVGALDASDTRWTTYSWYFAIAAGTAMVLFTVWSSLATVNARRLLAIPKTAMPQTSRIFLGAAFLGTALVTPGLFDRLDWSHLLSAGLAVVGLFIMPAPFAHLTRMANMSTVVIAPFRRWRGCASLAFICMFASHLMVRQRWGLNDLGDELSAEALAVVAAERAAEAVGPTTTVAVTTLAPVVTTIDPTLIPAVVDPASLVAQPVVPSPTSVLAAVIDPATASTGRSASQIVQQQLLADAGLMTLATLAMAVAAGAVAAGVWSLDRRHRDFARSGYTIREAKLLH